jgi:hypothetical protein
LNAVFLERMERLQKHVQVDGEYVRWAKRTQYIEIDCNREIRLCYTWRGRPYIFLHVHFRVLIIPVTFNKIISMVMFHFVSWFCPCSAFVIAALFFFSETVLLTFQRLWLRCYCLVSAMILPLFHFFAYLPFALFPEEARSDLDPCDCISAVEKIMNKQMAPYFCLLSANIEGRSGQRQGSPAQTH